MIFPASVFAFVLAAQPAPAETHSLTFWRQVVRNQYAPPDDADLPALANELTDMLASPDPEVRDEIAYSTLAVWIYQKRTLSADQLGPVTGRLLANLAVGDRDTDRVFRRSFSALTLSVVIARDNAAPFLTPQMFGRIEEAALVYLDAEQDLRGYDPEHGWMHSAAHTADLLKFLARSRFLEGVHQPRILDGISRKLLAAPTVFTHGEDERFARAILSIVNRPDFDRMVFDSWVSRSKPPRLSARPTMRELAGSQNMKNLLAKLDVLLTADVPPSANQQAAGETVRLALKDLF